MSPEEGRPPGPGRLPLAGTAILSSRPTRIAELVPLAPIAEGHHDASGAGAGGVWFPGQQAVLRDGWKPDVPILWRLQWPKFITDSIVSSDNPTGTITNSDLELAGGLLHLDCAAQTMDTRERTLLSKGDNLNTTFWERKGSTTTDSVPAYLLRMFGIHQRYHRYVPRFDYISGPSNPVADALSRDFRLSIERHPLTVVAPLPSERWLSGVDAAVRTRFVDHLRVAAETVGKGVSSGRAKGTITYWEKWLDFTTELGLDPFLEAFEDKVPILQVFMHRVRSGELAAHGNPIRARSTEDYVRAVAQTFLTVGADDPRYNSLGKIDFRIQRMVAAWKKEDPPAGRVKPIPIQVIRRIAYIAQHLPPTASTLLATADMIIIAFFYLLRPGEYTDAPSDTHPSDFATSSS